MKYFAKGSLSRRITVLIILLALLSSLSSVIVCYFISDYVVYSISTKVNAQILAGMKMFMKSIFNYSMKDVSLGNMAVVERLEQTRLVYTAGGILAANLIMAAILIPVSIRMTRRWRDNSSAELEERIESLEREKSLRNDFFTRMSHDIRTPLNGILGMADALEQNEDDAEIIAGIQTIKRSGNNLMKVVNEILDLSKLDAGKMNLHPSDINIADLVKESVSTIDSGCRQKGIKVSIDVDSNVPHIYHTDGHKLVRVLTNLLGNSLKFTDVGSLDVSVKKNESGKRGEILFKIVDTGRGIPIDRKDVIFESYVQAASDQSVKENGAGLGLAISRGLVELMGGEIWFDSEMGRGSTFYFTIG